MRALFKQTVDKRISNTDITIGEVKKAALGPISNVPVPIHSTFLAGCPFYDLCLGLVTNGQLTEALSSAKEAHRLLAKLFQRKFTHNVQQQNEEHNAIVDSLKSITDSVENIGLNLSVAREILLFDSISWDLKDRKVMQCYLQSTLLV
ncbi:separase-like isoform X1 [Vigna umbellata]|uniref:separase-like isoform X1 n=1 Tax=Vigna umbellata TaxID=87088 RepID=UPI001F5EB956|nr:separase-like isoform X1 [Vigna umbellata]